MLSQPQTEVPIVLEKELPPTRIVHNLKNSAFLRYQDDAIVPVRQSISALLLIAIWENQLEVVGMLHPAPTVPFDYRTLGNVPFLRVVWPITAKTIYTEWVVGHPNPSQYYHNKVTVTDAELRGK